MGSKLLLLPCSAKVSLGCRSSGLTRHRCLQGTSIEVPDGVWSLLCDGVGLGVVHGSLAWDNVGHVPASQELPEQFSDGVILHT